MLLKLLLIALGGGTGAVARYIMAGLAQAALTRSSGAAAGRIAAFPIGTLAVNAIGCLAIGLLGSAFLAAPSAVREEYRIAIMVGLLGGFTTFSAFGFETIALLQDGQYGRAMLNMLLMNVLCLAAVWIGFRLAGQCLPLK